MNTLINRFFTKNEPASVQEDFSEDRRYSFLKFLIELGSNSEQLESLSKRALDFVFPKEEITAGIKLVQFYLEFEGYLVNDDSHCTESKDSLRAMIRDKFPHIATTEAFLPLYLDEKSQELLLSQYFLKYVVRSFIKEQRSENLATRWLINSTLSELDATALEAVARIHYTRKLREFSRQIYQELVDSFGIEWVNTVLQGCYTNFTSCYQNLKTVRSINDFLPVGFFKVTNQHLPQKPNINGTTDAVSQKPEAQVEKTAILENILDGYLLMNRQAQIIDYNTKALELLAISAELLKKHTVLDFLPDELARLLKRDLDKNDPSIPNECIGKRHETTLINIFNTSHDFELSITNNYTEGEDTYSILLRNITNKKDSLKNISEAKLYAERMAKAKSTFLSNMSHEIRTPLNVILGLSEIIKKNTDIDGALLRKNLDGIDYSAQNLLAIVNDILDFSKIEAGKLSMQSIDFNLREVVEKLADGFEIKAREKGLTLVAEMDKEIPDIVIGDQFRLNQILNNLIGNAIKFTKTGEISIHVDLISQTEEDTKLQFKVKDSGIGIPKDKLNRIFDSFYQVEDPENSKITGTGLGLAITKELISLQNGKLQATSVVNEGSVFKFTLSFKKSKLTSLTSSAGVNKLNVKKLEGLKVLVAEDNKMNQFYIKQLLNNLKVEVDIAENGEEAVEIYQNSNYKYDLILMDMHMPVMNGFDAITKIKKSNEYSLKKVPIVVCSADVFPEARKNAIVAGVDFYLTKPLHEDAIKEVLYWLISDDEEIPVISTDTELYNTSPTDKRSTSIDIEQLLETFDNDEEFIISLLEIFIKITPEDYKSLRNCVDREYYARASTLAHKMKSSFMNLGMTSHGHHLQVIESSILKKEGIEEAKKHLAMFNKLYIKALLEVNVLLIEFRQK
jgi:signal transduction histidine kinase/CheY-like chemotaxis protein